MTTLTLNQAAQCVKAGGVVAYSTEAVFEPNPVIPAKAGTQ